jgi:hypothetical protein
VQTQRLKIESKSVNNYGCFLDIAVQYVLVDVSQGIFGLFIRAISKLMP